MILVTSSAVGAPALERMLRDGTVAPLGNHAARPHDVPDSPGLRALAAHGRVPSHTALTGLAALWIHCWRPLPPTRWHLVGERGLYRTTDTSLVFHSGATARLASRIGPVAVAPPARACLDALRWEPAEPALEAVVGAVLDGRIVPEALDAALEFDSARGAGHARLTSLVAAVTALAGHRLEAPAAGQPGRLAPVIRRAS